MRVHELKIKKCYMIEILCGVKLFEIRKNDRGFEIGDLLLLKEIDDESGEYTNCEILVKVIYIHKGLGMEDGYVCMSIKRVEIKSV